eukprot:TRINITY_DN2167_c0_g1_i3.p1 TRINITY_DN2167_c0_g1~~TRINITY_DN2167_c0_g1_i3.p1  ORF type:complete len:645 (+),score=208.58 TRINITY_DN2167_c0_g1_i3:51-1937(+)
MLTKVPLLPSLPTFHHLPFPSSPLSNTPSPSLHPQTVIRQWKAGTDAAESGDYSTAIRNFKSVGDNAKMFYNIAMCYLRQSNTSKAFEALEEAIECDPYFGAAYFHRALLSQQSKEYAHAVEDYDFVVQLFRDADYIDYNQLGLEWVLRRCETLFNRAQCYLAMGETTAAAHDLSDAANCTVDSTHYIIGECSRSNSKASSTDSFTCINFYLAPEIPEGGVGFKKKKTTTISSSSGNGSNISFNNKPLPKPGISGGGGGSKPLPKPGTFSNSSGGSSGGGGGGSKPLPPPPPGRSGGNSSFGSNSNNSSNDTGYSIGSASGFSTTKNKSLPTPPGRRDNSSSGGTGGGGGVGVKKWGGTTSVSGSTTTKKLPDPPSWKKNSTSTSTASWKVNNSGGNSSISTTGGESTGNGGVGRVPSWKQIGNKGTNGGTSGSTTSWKGSSTSTPSWKSNTGTTSAGGSTSWKGASVSTGGSTTPSWKSNTSTTNKWSGGGSTSGGTVSSGVSTTKKWGGSTTSGGSVSSVSTGFKAKSSGFSVKPSSGGSGGGSGGGDISAKVSQWEKLKKDYDTAKDNDDLETALELRGKVKQLEAELLDAKSSLQAQYERHKANDELEEAMELRKTIKALDALS